MGGKSNEVTVGYRYFMDLHFGICHGPVDALSEIRVGGRTAYAAEVTASQTIYINSPKLFGGDKREGGIQGYADVLGGETTQGVNEYLQEKIGAEARVPAFRGLFALVYKGGLVASNNPYIKPWAFKVRRINAGWGDLVPQEVTEIAADSLPDWGDGTRDPRDLDYLYDYKYDGVVYDTFEDAKAAAEADIGYDLTDHFGWRIGTYGDPPSKISGLSTDVDPGEREYLNLVTAGATGAAYVGNLEVSNQRVISNEEFNAAPDAGFYFPFGGFYDLGINVNGYFIADVASAHLYYLKQASIAGYGEPAPTLSVDGWVGVNNCVAAFGCPYPGSGSHLVAALRQGLTDISVRRLPSPPVLPGKDLPDWPEDPANYWWDESTGEIYSKEPYVETAGSYRWLSLYSVTGGGNSTVQRKPLGPVLAVGDPNDTEEFWQAARDAAVLAGTLPSAVATYNAAGTGGITTFPRNASYAWTRTYNVFVPSEPPDPGLAQIGDDMNPAHIVRQCITNTEWGMGYPDALIGESFTTCAQTLYDEEFGLSFQWTQQEPIEDFIGQVLNHCGGVWYADPRTGLFEMALIRDDYSVSDLREFNESNILAVESYQRPGYGELVNEITVTWTDVPNNRTATTAPHQDPACIAAQGSVISEVRNYPGITKAVLAQRVALRDLTAASTPLASIKLKVNREGWDLIPGKDCIVLSWAKLGIVQLVCRVLKVDRGSLEDGVITLEVAEDVFGLPDAVYTTQESEEWTDPNVEPDDISMQDLVESPYWDVARNLSAADLDYTDVDAGYVFTLAGRNSDIETSYGIWSRTGSDEYEDRGDGPFAPTALLNGAIDQQATSLTIDNGVDLDLVEVGDRVLIGSGRLAEFCEVLSLDTTTGAITVTRAVLDTTPQEHADNTRVWFVENSFGVDQTERATSDEVDVKLTAIATGGESDIEDATEQTITMAGRFGRPYPPGRIRINGVAFPTTVDTTEDASEGFVITWNHRDRTQQTADLVSQEEGNIGPEAGTTYSVEIYNDATEELVDSVTGISDTSLSLTVSESFLARLEVYSVRDGIESWQRQVRRFTLIGTDVFVSEDGDYFITEDGQILAPE